MDPTPTRTSTRLTLKAKENQDNAEEENITVSIVGGYNSSDKDMSKVGSDDDDDVTVHTPDVKKQKLSTSTETVLSEEEEAKKEERKKRDYLDTSTFLKYLVGKVKDDHTFLTHVGPSDHGVQKKGRGFTREAIPKDLRFYGITLNSSAGTMMSVDRLSELLSYIIVVVLSLTLT